MRARSRSQYGLLPIFNPLNDAFAAAPSSRATTRAVTFTVDALSNRSSLPFTPIATSFTLKSIRWLLPSVTYARPSRMPSAQLSYDSVSPSCT